MLENFQFYLEHYPLLALLLAFVGGVLASFTPCIYPVIPITVSYIGGASRGKNKFSGFILSFSYVSGMALTYSLLGIFAALSGKIFGQISANPYINLFVANLCIVMGLHMLDVISLPFLSSSKQITSKKSGILGAFLLGLGSGFIAAPCTAPILAALLSLIAMKKQVVFGFFLLFFFAFGMGTLIILLGTFTGLVTSLPKSGKWTETIKHIFGYALIAVGEYFLVQMGKYL